MPGKYDNLTKDQLIACLEALEKRKKYGLVWEEERVREQFEQDAQNAIPVLQEVKSRVITTDPSQPTHILIEGDNYHALTTLNYTHQGKIDVIYIDPPYNTGNKDFKYNDQWVDAEDSFRHSKWLSFMEKRLVLAKNLLKSSGVIFISIDDNEYATLKMLCDDIFSTNNYYGTIVRRRRQSQANLSKNLSVIHEYILCYACSRDAVLLKIDAIVNEQDFKNPDKDPRGPYVTMPCSNKGGSQYKIVTPTGREHLDEWRFSQETYRELEKDGRVVFPKGGDGKPRYKLFLLDKKEAGVIPNSWWDDAGSNQEASRELKEIIGEKLAFNNPKPVSLLTRIVGLAIGKDGVVLDFFAGSGTAGHAVLDLNKKDGGNRQFILCTNNEENICQDICHPRLKKVIQGYKDKPALGGNLKYFKTHFIPKTANKDDLKIRVTRECAELLCLRESIFNEVTKGKLGDSFCIFEQAGRILAIYYSLDRRDLPKLKKVLDKMAGTKILYCFTLDPLGLDEQDFEDWTGVELKDIPQKILDIYEGLR